MDVFPHFLLWTNIFIHLFWNMVCVCISSCRIILMDTHASLNSPTLSLATVTKVQHGLAVTFIFPKGLVHLLSGVLLMLYGLFYALVSPSQCLADCCTSTFLWYRLVGNDLFLHSLMLILYANNHFASRQQAFFPPLHSYHLRFCPLVTGHGPR